MKVIQNYGKKNIKERNINCFEKVCDVLSVFLIISEKMKMKKNENNSNVEFKTSNFGNAYVIFGLIRLLIIIKPH